MRPSLTFFILTTISLSAASPQPTLFKRQTQTTSISVPPLPTESTGCVLHIDHYHCEGPISGSSGNVSPSHTYSEEPDAHESGHDHDHDHDAVSGVMTVSGTLSVPPPPTESVGCSLHGDHYHCQGPATSLEGVSGSVSSGRVSVTAAVNPSTSRSASMGSSSSTVAVSRSQSSIASSVSAGAANSSGAANTKASLPENILASVVVGTIAIFVGASAVF